ncbi:Centrosomal protein of 152 kDa [Eumeta japonica]|uniref:Centrosomal protein of 152 kDa n=1 Tax=Eumeta variegata TaxID=151549 RepID=A0A4C1VES6_EUMVA|nr:Centrosomal protein of 152 kDa [Eumeta japonica]
MEVPGMSLFRGAGSIHINNSTQDRLDEQEELEDQKRRNEELKHKLDNAFDDLVDDDDASSVNSSANFTMNVTHPDSAQGDNPNTEDFKTHKPPGYTESVNHLKDGTRGETPKSQVHCETPKSHNSPYTQTNEPLKYMYNAYGAGDGQNNIYHHQYPGHLNGLNFNAHQEMMNHEQLKLMYEMRVKECQQLAEQLENLHSHSDAEIEGLRARLVTACSDRDRAELSLQQAQHLLASSKHNIVSLEQQITSLNERLAESEQEKEQLKLELRSASVGLQDAQQKLQNIQVTRNYDKDALFRELQDSHREEVDRLHSDLLKFKNRLEEKEKEIKILEQRCLEKDRTKEELLIEKGAKINRLASELEAAQNRLVSGESAKLKERVSQLTSERNMAKDQVKELGYGRDATEQVIHQRVDMTAALRHSKPQKSRQCVAGFLGKNMISNGSKLELTAHELVLCRNKLSQAQKQFEEFRTALTQIIQETLPDQAYLGEASSPSKLSTLKEILNRSKQQVQKIANLQEEVLKRDKKLEIFRNQESELRSKLEEQKSIEMQLNSKVALLQNKLELLGNDSDAELLINYKQRNSQLEQQLKELRAEHKVVELKYAELELQHEKLRAERTSHASLVQEANADLLRELERISSHLKETLKECAELKTLYLDVCSARDAISRELQDAKSKLALMQREKTSITSQEKELSEKLDKEKQQVAKLTAELTNEREGLERANKRISELQKEFTDKQKDFTDRLNKYIEGTIK